MSYWYCLNHRAVELDEGCPDSERLGPYGTQADAEAALQRAQARTDKWDNDARWNDEERLRERRRSADASDLED
ncbi:MAG: hypothetical protein ACOYEV_16995 [Candidatus Nanopelagicales bacterium]